MKILSVWYGRCGWYGGPEVATWEDAEKFAEDELLEDMDFTNVKHLSPKDANFPFDFTAERNGIKCLIDVTLRTRKPVRTKRLQTWRSLDYKTMLLLVLPEWMMSVLVELEDSDNWINLSPKTLRSFEKEFLRPLHT